MAELKSGYSERVLGNSCVVEKLHSGFYRVITEDGRDDQLRAVHQLHVGDVGRTVYYGDGMSYGLTRFDADPAVKFDFEKAKSNYPYGWKDHWPSGLSKDAEALFKIFKDVYVENGCMYSGMIPFNAPPICGYPVSALYELVSAGILQKRDCDGDSFELTAQERLKLIDAHNLQEAWKESRLGEWSEDEVTRVMCLVGESSLGDKIADAQQKSAKLAESKKSIDLSEYEYISNVNGYSTFCKIVPDGNGGTKGVWAAMHQDGGEPFEISYAQARGFEPIDNSPIKQLARQLGEMLLP